MSGRSLGSLGSNKLDLLDATIVVRCGDAVPEAEKTAARVLSEEVGRRTGRAWPVSPAWPGQGPVVVVLSGTSAQIASRAVPQRAWETRPEGYTVFAETDTSRPGTVWIVGADPAGALFGVGRFLRALEWQEGACWLEGPLDESSAPAYPIRGHQLGYRATANSYDAWDGSQMEQYIRELSFFGANAVENIPFQDHDSPVMKVPRWDMNIAMSRLCQQYGLAYWVWTPADFDLKDDEKRRSNLLEYERLFQDCPKLDAIFFPGGDPGNNHPHEVLPFMEEVAQRMLPAHPKCRIWISLQGFDGPKVDAFYDGILKREPDWLGGVVAGPSSPAIPATRARLLRRYGLRHYPDLTHTVRSQYPTPWWDPAFGFTLGREPVNPEPLRYAEVHNTYAPYTDGFLSYSDGVHDDVNKTIWSALSWDPSGHVRDILVEYSRVFFGSKQAEPGADGILMLEQNWRGSLVTNPGAEATQMFWKGLQSHAPHLASNWRWQMCLLRANYDAFVRQRLLLETGWEKAANQALASASVLGSEASMRRAREALAANYPERTQVLRGRVISLCEDLYQSIGLQTSVSKYHASGAERGAVLDFIDIPLNNRWWLEDEMSKALALTHEEDRVARLMELGTWECPEPGALYDEVGHVGRSPHVIRGEGTNTDPNTERNPNPDLMWWDSGRCRRRLSWISKMDWPLGLRYEGLDDQAQYVVRTTGLRDCLLRANGVRIDPAKDGREIGEIKEFLIPKELTQSRSLTLTFDVPQEPDLNWRLQSRLTEVWLIKR